MLRTVTKSNQARKRKYRVRPQFDTLEDRQLLSTMVADCGEDAKVDKPISPTDIGDAAQIRVVNETGEDSAALQGLQSSFLQQTKKHFQDGAKFHSLMGAVYGDNYDTGKAEAFRQMAINGDLTFLPGVQFVGNQVLHGAEGAYDGVNQVVYLADGLKGNLGQLQQVYMEEVGHHLDARLNKTDTHGDEGEYFRRVVSGEKLSESQLAQIRADNDKGEIEVNGKKVEVEFFLKKVWNGIKKVTSNVWKATVHWGKQIARTLAYGTMDTLAGLRDFGKHVVKGDFKAAGKAFGDAAKSFVGTIFDTHVVVLRGHTDVLASLLHGRGLNNLEKNLLRSVYGGSLNVDAIRIFQKSPTANIGRDYTIGDHIYLRGSLEIENGDLTLESKALLAHEAAHVWQSQKFGNGYIHRSVIDQITQGDGAYEYLQDFLNGKDFRDMGAEQQAHFIETIAIAVVNSGLTLSDINVTTAAQFRNEIQNLMQPGLTLTDEQFHRVLSTWYFVQTAGIHDPQAGASIATRPLGQTTVFSSTNSQSPGGGQIMIQTPRAGEFVTYARTRHGTQVRKTYSQNREVMQETWQGNRYTVDVWTRNRTHVRRVYQNGRMIQQQMWQGSRYTIDTRAADGTHVRATYQGRRKVMQQVWQRRGRYTEDTWTMFGEHTRKSYRYGRKVMQQTWQRGIYSKTTWSRRRTIVRKMYVYGRKVRQETWRRGRYTRDDWTNGGYHIRTTKVGWRVYQQIWNRYGRRVR